jgi:hypothetical protein
MCLTATFEIGEALGRPLPGSRLHPKHSTATEHSSQCGILTELIPVMGQNRKCFDDRFWSDRLRLFGKIADGHVAIAHR